MMLVDVLGFLKKAWNKCQVRSVLMRSVLSIIPLMMCISFQYCAAQNRQADTVGIIEKIVERKDTMVRYTVPEVLPQRWSRVLEKPIDSALYRKYGTRFRQELYNLLIREGTRDTPKHKLPTTNTSQAALDGKIIRRIEFYKVNVFSPSVSDTNYVPPTWFENVANVMHNDTRTSILKRYMLVKPGESLDVFALADNERILRDLSFIMDAKFVARPIQGNSDSVDLLLLTQDLFPIGLEVDMVKSNLALIGISHQNFLGYGHQLIATTYWDPENKPLIGYRLSYGTANLAGTFASGKFEYVHRWNQESYIFNFVRDFRTSSFKNAGGFIIENTDIRKNIELLDTTLWNVDLKYTNTDFWAGRLMLLNSSSQWMKSGLFITGRFNQYESHDGPVTSDDYLYSLQDRTMMFFSTGFTRQGFRKDNMIYTFGRTEDVPYGYLFDIISGYEWGEYKARPYFSVGASAGNYFSNSAYWYGQLKLGTFINQGSMEQGTLRIQATFFSPLFFPSRFRYRHFMNLTYLHGINRFKGEFATVENQNGITGLTSPSMRWNDKLVLNLESVIFSPYKFLGFRFAFFGSFDVGLVASENLRMDDSRLFLGISTGVRIRNDQLVFNTFVIKFSIYPGLPYDGSAQYFIVDNLSRSRFQDFFPYKPAIVTYK